MPAVPDPGYTYARGHDNDGVDAVVRLLEVWFLAIEDGTVTFRQPALSYPKTWTEEQLDALVRDIDAEIDQEVTRLPGTQAKVQAQAGPGFQRLASPQRLALAQELHAAIEAHREALHDYFPTVEG